MGWGARWPVLVRSTDSRFNTSPATDQVDVCLYFVAAHRLKHIDLKFMRAIAARVALIPVIAKADRCGGRGELCLLRNVTCRVASGQLNALPRSMLSPRPYTA